MFFLSLVAILAALQSYAEIRGLAPSILGARDYISESWTRPYIPDPHGKNNPILERIFPALRAAPALKQSEQLESLREILDRVHALGSLSVDLDLPSPHDLSVIVRCDPLAGETPEHSVVVETAKSSHVIPESEEDKLRAWKHLSSSERGAWKQRLADAGRWTASEGESVLEGVLFSETCGRLADKVKEKLS
jgi:glycyl-tRNA synthetase